MNRSELIRSIAERLPEIPEQDVEQAVKVLLEQLSSSLAEGARCEIRGFGTFSVRTRNARLGRNPKTGKPVALPEKRVAHFKPGKLLAKMVNLGQTEHPI